MPKARVGQVWRDAYNYGEDSALTRDPPTLEVTSTDGMPLGYAWGIRRPSGTELRVKLDRQAGLVGYTLLKDVDPGPIYWRDWCKAHDVDWLRKDPAYWKDIFRRMRAEGVHVRPGDAVEVPTDRTPLAALVTQERARQRREASMAKMPPVESYGPLAGWLQSQLDDMVREVDDPAVDNLRWAEKSVSRQRRAYYRAKASGCCGSEDREVTHPETGRVFLIGCNYGH